MYKILRLLPVKGALVKHALKATFDGYYVQYHIIFRPQFVSKEDDCSHFSGSLVNYILAYSMQAVEKAG